MNAQPESQEVPCRHNMLIARKTISGGNVVLMGFYDAQTTLP